jgi:lysozyme
MPDAECRAQGCCVKLGEKGAELIKAYEELRLEAYLPTPDDVPTIGWGHTRGVAMGDTCTREQAQIWFMEDIAWAVDCVNRAVKVPMTQPEFDALCSLCFNIGCPAFSGSTLVKLLNESDYDGASEQFRRWNKQNGKVLAGLTNRRAAEAALFEENA